MDVNQLKLRPDLEPASVMAAINPAHPAISRLRPEFSALYGRKKASHNQIVASMAAI